MAAVSPIPTCIPVCLSTRRERELVQRRQAENLERERAIRQLSSKTRFPLRSFGGLDTSDLNRVLGKLKAQAEAMPSIPTDSKHLQQMHFPTGIPVGDVLEGIRRRLMAMEKRRSG